MKIRLASELQIDSIVDGPGIRTVIWTQGCSHNCLGCHNPSTHDFKGGFLKEINELKEELDMLSFQDGVTFSGGDPFFQPEACAILANHIHSLGMDVWCYTGFTFEQLLENSKKNKKIMNFLTEIDIIVDGKFELDKRNLDLKFRGSSNQRIIDVNKSLKQGKTVVLDLDEKIIFNFGRNSENIYV